MATIIRNTYDKFIMLNDKFIMLNDKPYNKSLPYQSVSWRVIKWNLQQNQNLFKLTGAWDTEHVHKRDRTEPGALSVSSNSISVSDSFKSAALF